MAKLNLVFFSRNTLDCPFTSQEIHPDKLVWPRNTITGQTGLEEVTVWLQMLIEIIIKGHKVEERACTKDELTILRQNRNALLFSAFLKIYLFTIRERECMSVGGEAEGEGARERERERKS